MVIQLSASNYYLLNSARTLDKYLPIEKIFELEIYCFEFLIQSLITRSITCNTHSKIEEEI